MVVSKGRRINLPRHNRRHDIRLPLGPSKPQNPKYRNPSSLSQCHNLKSSAGELELHVSHAENARESAMATSLVKLAVSGPMTAATIASHDAGGHIKRLLRKLLWSQNPRRNLPRILADWFVGWRQILALRLCGRWASKSTLLEHPNLAFSAGTSGNDIYRPSWI